LFNFPFLVLTGGWQVPFGYRKTYIAFSLTQWQIKCLLKLKKRQQAREGLYGSLRPRCAPKLPPYSGTPWNSLTEPQRRLQRHSRRG